MLGKIFLNGSNINIKNETLINVPNVNMEEIKKADVTKTGQTYSPSVDRFKFSMMNITTWTARVKIVLYGFLFCPTHHSAGKCV